METPTTHFASCARPASTRGRLEHPPTQLAQRARRENISSRRGAPLNLIAKLVLQASIRQREALRRPIRAMRVQWESILRQKAANQAPLVNLARPESTDPTVQGPFVMSVYRGSFRIQ